MDINFHYFAVKTIASKAGFDKDDAQLIAAYSQFVDDYNIWMNYTMLEVPAYAQSLAEKKGDKYEFYTVTTGFTDYMDIARLVLFEKYQKEVLVPFHFIPWQPLPTTPTNDRSLWRTQRADITGTSLIAQLIKNAKNTYMNEHDPEQKRYDLIRIGVLLHIFADTFAHQHFSGLHGWENFAYVTALKDVVTEEDIPEKNLSDKYGKVYALGHADVGHAPDMTYAYFDMTYAENEDQKKIEDYTGHYSRSNTQVFGNAAKQIFKLLYQMCHQNNDPTNEKWQELLALLQAGFALQTTKENKLECEWSHICNEIDYCYDKDELWKNQLVPLGDQSFTYENRCDNISEEDMALKSGEGYSYRTASDDFFHFNLIAKEIRDAVLNE